MTVILVLVISVMTASYLSLSVGSARQVNRHSDAYRLDSAAESTISLAVHRFWSDYLNSRGGDAGTLSDLRAYLSLAGLEDSGPAATPTSVEGMDLLRFLNLPQGGSADDGLAGVNVETVEVVRADDFSSTTLHFSATVSSRLGDGGIATPVRRTINEAFVAEGAGWAGLDYALLGNNVNCIMCHTQVDSANRFYNEDPLLRGTFDRVKVGTLESLLLRSSAQSAIAGTLYVRGIATDKAGTPITDWSAQTIYSAEFDKSYGHLTEDAWGNLTAGPLDPADPDNLVPFENLYLDYSMDDNSMVDGYLPQSFPPPFPDENANRVIDPEEFAAVASEATGSISGGSIYVAAPGEVIDSSSELNTALTTGTQSALPTGTEGNVVLIGTEQNPIVLDGQVAIDGDVVIQGYVVGDGSLLASGNVYLPSDLQYLDGTTQFGGRDYGNGANGTPNDMVLASGGSIIVGDLFFTRSGSVPTGDESGVFGFVMSEVALFNRGEWAKTQPVLPGLGDDFNDPTTWSEPNVNYEGPDYLPRYYTFTDDGTIPIFNVSDSRKKPMYYDAASESWKGKEHPGSWRGTKAYPNDPNDPYLYNADGTPKAVVQQLTATDGWISNDMLTKMMKDFVAGHDPDEPLKVDSLLYTNNSIFGLVGRSTPMKGRMIVNGAIIAADVGLLVPGNGGTGLNLNYDPRGKDKLRLKALGEIQLFRKLATTVGVHP